MRELVPAIFDEIEEGRERDLFDEIMGGFKRHRVTPDIESIFSIVDAIAKDLTAEDLGYPSWYLVSEVLQESPRSSLSSGKRESQLAENLLTTLKERVRALCSPETLDTGGPELFRPFLNLFQELETVQGAFAPPSDSRKGPFTRVQFPIFTTNYDFVVERLFHGRGLLNTPFMLDETRTPVFHVSQLNANDPRLVKLHGSFDWYLLRDGRVVEHPKGGGHVGDVPIDAQVMLYPIQQKDLYLRPWMDLLAQFKLDLSQRDCWLFIGYSFQDEFIRTVIKEALHSGPKRMVVLHPHPSDILGWLDRDEKPKVTTVSDRLGSSSAAVRAAKSFGVVPV